MRIVRVIGGLGNQMFQYAFAYALKKAFCDEKVLLDTLLYEKNVYHQGLEIDKIFPLQLDVATVPEIKSVCRLFRNYYVQRFYERFVRNPKNVLLQSFDSEYIPEVFSRKESTYYNGFWQNSKYFDQYRSDIKKFFTFIQGNDPRNLSLIDDIKKSNQYVSIHVRRGDYLSVPKYTGICTEEYYKNAIDYMESAIEKPRYLIFSDDKPWCEQFFSDLFQDKSKYRIVDWNKNANSYVDMELMSYCSGMIIANSTFSWWAAYLNPRNNPLIVSPRKWKTNLPECDRQLDTWHLL